MTAPHFPLIRVGKSEQGIFNDPASFSVGQDPAEAVSEEIRGRKGNGNLLSIGNGIGRFESRLLINGAAGRGGGQAETFGGRHPAAQKKPQGKSV